MAQWEELSESRLHERVMQYQKVWGWGKRWAMPHTIPHTHPRPSSTHTHHHQPSHSHKQLVRVTLASHPTRRW